MGFRFRRSIKLAPGVRLSFSTRGAGLSLGPRGASVSIGQRGIYGNLGLPGTGLSYRERLDRPTRPAASSRPSAGTLELELKVSVTDEGQVEVRDSRGQLIAEDLRARALRENRDAVLELLERRRLDLEAEQGRGTDLHHDTPAPLEAGALQPDASFTEPCPEKPEPESVGLFGRLFGQREAAEQRHREALSAYRQDLEHWIQAKARHSEMMALRERAHQGDGEAMEAYIEYRLGGIAWPQETSVDFELERDRLRLDVDLPEIEDMPTHRLQLRKREYRLVMVENSATQQRKDYATHVHGVVFRLAGEAFAALPTLRETLVSAYSQRRSRATGTVEDEYLLSVRVDREAWSRIDFVHLHLVDPIEALEQFELRREMTRTGIFRPIEPME
ncbi:DUF4236 domain-containing protein [Allochromatium vinosum]|uniref:DUF4236 domain-containing protein n=1 Tax=Allochromatium vinosum TaxID=1049 RepID=UPI001903198F|nr:DUF4236 domain-containing protein [Allochromatium vinosum]MBK1656531.1 hypothetical protein [Allochromatium vinosum]